MIINEFLTGSAVLLDVRSPSEYQRGHIPGAISFPLFTDAERREVGTLYKQQGNRAAVRRGLEMVGPKLSSFVEGADRLGTQRFRLYCWRGGMRSGSMAWLLETAGYPCERLTGGYKAFRRWVNATLQKPYLFKVLGGLTGSGKTKTLQQLTEQAIDLEALACHRGSCFGHLGCSPQPTNEQFSNLLAWKLSHLDPQKPTWIEDESRMIGNCQIPSSIYVQMRQAPFVWLDKPKEERIQNLVQMYGDYPPQALIAATQRLQKRLGSDKTQHAVSLIQNGQLKAALTLILDYYDKAYLFSLNARDCTIV